MRNSEVEGVRLVEGVRRSGAAGSLWREWQLYLAEGLTSAAATWFCTGIFFVTRAAFGWSAQQNLALAAGQGVVYVCGALVAARVSGRLGRRWTLVGVYGLLGVLTAAMAGISSPVVFLAVLSAWTFLCAVNWPSSEAMLCHGSTAGEVSRRVGTYNLVWATTGALAIAVMGFMSARQIFLGAAVLHGMSAALVFLHRREAVAGQEAHLEAPADLLARRTLAKRLSRLALPASYTIAYVLVALLASLPAVSGLSSGAQGVVVSVWMLARVGAFAVMGRTSGWHGRPGVLMVAVVVMSVSFVGAMVPVGGGWGVGWLAGWQVLLGSAMGVIYAGSLYFGMVLAHGGEGDGGSTEQGGYHEALVGAGTILGPGVAAVSGVMGLNPAVGVAAILGCTTVACARAAMTAR